MTVTVNLSRDELVELTRRGLEEITSCAVTRVEPHQYSQRQSSSIVCLTVQFADGSGTQVWSKSLHPGGENDLKERRTIRDFDLHRFLHAKLDPDGPFRVARALYHSVEHRLIVTEHVPGTTLYRLIKSRGRLWHLRIGSGLLIQDSCRVGAWLRAFQSVTRDYFPGKEYGQPAPRVKNTAFVVAQAQTRLYQLEAEQSHFFSHSLLEAIREYLKHASNRFVSDDARCCIHGDFFPDNIFVQPDRITGLDFTSATWGLPEFDPSYFVFQLETLTNNPTYSKDLVFRLRAAFLEGYFDTRESIDYWKLNPKTHLLFVTLSLSRMLALAKMGHSGILDRFVARRQSLELEARLIAHVEYGVQISREN